MSRTLFFIAHFVLPFQGNIILGGIVTQGVALG
jgi:hypothetical protein